MNPGMESAVELPEPKLTLRQAMSQHVLEQGAEQRRKQLDTYLPEIVMFNLWAKLTMPGDRISFHPGVCVPILTSTLCEFGVQGLNNDPCLHCRLP
jgi:hypothetical protein